MARLPEYRTIKAHCQKHGFFPAMNWTFTHYIAGYIRRLFKLEFIDSHIYACDIPKEIEFPYPDVPVTVEAITSEHVERMREWLPKGKAERFLNRIASSQYGLVCILEGEIAYFSWFTVNDEYVDALRSTIHLSPEEGYLFDSYCRPAYRKHGLHNYIVTKSLEKLRKLGRTRAQVVVRTWNFHARQALAKSNFKPVKRVLIVEWRGKVIMRMNRRVQRLKWEKRTPAFSNNTPKSA